MKLTVQTFLTLDGVMQAPGGPEEDPSDTFTHGGWQAPFPDPAVGEFVTKLNSHASPATSCRSGEAANCSGRCCSTSSLTASA